MIYMQFIRSSKKSSLELEVQFLNIRFIYLVPVVLVNAILEAVYTEYTSWINCTVSATKIVSGKLSKANTLTFHAQKKKLL